MEPACSQYPLDVDIKDVPSELAHAVCLGERLDDLGLYTRSLLVYNIIHTVRNQQLRLPLSIPQTNTEWGCLSVAIGPAPNEFSRQFFER